MEIGIGVFDHAMVAQDIMPQGSLRFWIFDAMADDWESMVQIASVVDEWWQSMPRQLIAEEIVLMIGEGLVQEMPHDDRGDDPAIPEAIVAEPSRFWFGMTDRGRKLWAEISATIEFPEEGT